MNPLPLPPDLTQPTAWAEPPKRWSYSTLRKARDCPRSFQLLRSTWSDPRALEDPPRLAALTGQIVHKALEKILHSLVLFGLPERRSPAFRQALQHANHVNLLLKEVARLNLALEQHPRGHLLLREPIHVHQLAADVNALLQQQYAALQARRVELLHLTAAAAHPPAAPTPEPLPLPLRLRRDGILSETHLSHPTLRLHGVLDVVYTTPDGPVVADFKTGAAYATHRDQLALYALLWRSVTGDLPCAAEVLYASHTDRFTFSHADLDALQAELHTLIDDLDRQLAQPALADAHPGEPCTFCPARTRCDAFWQHRRDTLPPDERLRSGTTPLRVLHTLSPYAFLASTDDLPEVTVTLASHAPLAIDTLRPDQPLRVLNAKWRDEENALEITPWTEVLG